MSFYVEWILKNFLASDGIGEEVEIELAPGDEGGVAEPVLETTQEAAGGREGWREGGEGENTLACS